MKKRKILLGLALAAAAVFSLSACGDDTTPTTTPTTEDDGGSGTGTGTGTGTVTPTTEQVKVQYYKVIEGESPVEITGAKQEINKGSTTTKPETALAVDGYRIVEYYTSAGCSDVFDFTKAINADTKVYVKYVQITKYDELSASANKLVAYDFNTAMTLDVASDLKFEATEPKIVAKDDAVKVQNDVLSFGTGSSAAIVDFGRKITNTGVFNIYYELEFTSKTASGESIAQINGTNDGTTYARVFELRNDGSGLAYSFDGTSKVTTNPAVSISQGKKLNLLIVLDTAAGKVEVYNDGEKIVDAVTSIVGVNGLKFQQNSAKSTFTVDNLAVTYEEKAASGLVGAKNAAVSTIDTYLAGTDYAALDSAVKTLTDEKATTIKTAIKAAETEEAVATETAKWTAFLAAEKPVITVKAYTAANTAASVDDYKLAVVSGETPDLSKTSFTGFLPFEGSTFTFYTDEALTTTYTPAAVTAATTLFAKVKSSATVSSYNLSYEDFDTSATLNGQVANGFTITAGSSTTIASNSVKFATNGSKTADNIAITLAAGTYLVTVNAKSGSSGNNATLAVDPGTAVSLTFANDAASDQSTTVTLTEETTVYFYRNGGKTVNLYTISVVKQ